MRIDLHPKIEKLAEALADFHCFRNVDSYLEDLIRQAAEKSDFRNRPLPEPVTNASPEATKETTKPNKKGRVNGHALPAPDSLSQEAEA